ncbi:unspecific monooxygenase [Sarracenia purpurea var. burkii]
MDLLSLIEAIGIFIAILVLCKLWMLKGNLNNHVMKGVEPPEAKGALPIIGHLHLLGGKTPVFRTLAAMADRNGPIFKIRLGMRQAILVSSKETIMECLTINDRAFLSRPMTAALKYMGYGGAMFVIAPYGPNWSEFRRVITNHLLSNRCLDSMKCILASEVDSGIQHLYSLCSGNSNSNSNSNSVKIDISRWFLLLIRNMMIRPIAGRRFSFKADETDKEGWRFGDAMDKFVSLLCCFEVSDVISIPGIEWMDLQGHLKSMKQNAEELDYFMSKWLEEHFQGGQNDQTKIERDFMDMLVRLFPKGGAAFGHKNEDFIKATSLSLVMAGSDTTSGTLSWALSLLLNHEKALKIVQEEIDINVGRERLVEESDINNLVYLKAVVKETMRLYPAGPLSVHRESTEDCNIAGYHVPKGTRLIVHLWKLHRDARVWDNPNEFRPERFLDDIKSDLRRRHFEYLPFNSGRRSCPGMAMAFQMMHLTLARLLQSFNLATPMNKPIDMTESLGPNLHKATPLQVLLSPRLPCKLYQH